MNTNRRNLFFIILGIISLAAISNYAKAECEKRYLIHTHGETYCTNAIEVHPDKLFFWVDNKRNLQILERVTVIDIYYAKCRIEPVPAVYGANQSWNSCKVKLDI